MNSSGPTGDTLPRNHGRTRLLPLLVGAMLLVASIAVLAYFVDFEDTLKIAIMMPGDTKFSHLNETVGAMNMAVDDLNKWGGINNQRIEIVSASPTDDDDPEEMFREIDKEYHPLFFVVGSCDLLAAVSPAADELGIPVIGISSAPGMTEGHPWVFRYYTSAAMEASSALEIIEEIGVTSLGMIYTDDRHGRGVTALLEESFSAIGGEVESEVWSFNTGSQAGIVTNLSDNEAIYVVGPCAVALSMLRAVMDNGYTGEVIASSCLSTPLMWGLPELEGVYLSSPLLYKPENILALSFSEKFEERYGLPLTHHAAAGYDIVKLVYGVIHGSESSRENLKHQLESGFVFTGVLGNLVAPPGTHDFIFPVFPSYVSGGELWYL